MTKDSKAFYQMIREFLTVYLPKQKAASPNTIRSYRSALNMYLDFSCQKLEVRLDSFGFTLATRGLLEELSQKNPGVEVVLFTENGHGNRGFLTTSVVSDFINQYPPLRVKPNPDCHDRLIVLDYGFPSEQAYHCGASSKDAGRKLCAINKVESVQMIRPVIDALLKLPDKSI